MKEFIETYKQYQEEIEFFLQESVRNLGELTAHKENKFSKLFNLFPSLNLSRSSFFIASKVMLSRDIPISLSILSRKNIRKQI